ncbi:MAG: cobyrinate a,c-diamide synthase, partial [Firmicutes bacterium]|nr:cobyrinate a,c-diamide synthase [Bacillota bacterium]
MTKRIVIAGTQSGCGKTTITCALLKAMMNRGLKPAAFKCGPDYIDPMFHSEIVGAKSSNLDSFFFDDNTIRYLLAENSKDCDIAVIEGVMGYYDGMGFEDSSASCWDISRITDSPVVLVINAKGISVSALALIEGFVNYKSDSRIKGVIFNGCSAHAYEGLKKAVLNHFGGSVIPLGFMPRIEAAELSSRHLGLVTAQEVEDLTGKINLLADAAEKYIDIDALLRLSESAPELKYEEPGLTKHDAIRIAVAKDK